MRCTYCGARTHTERNCPKTANGQMNRARMRCEYCGSDQHNVDACPKTFNGSADRAWHPESIADEFVED